MIRCEVIIACRGELPENIERTINSIEKTMGRNDTVTVVLDGDHDQQYRFGTEQPWNGSHGPGACRDWAIKRSDAKYVVLVDGHMTFPAGWLDMIVDHLKKKENRNHTTCAFMQALDKDWQPSKTEAIYNRGCHLETIQAEESRKNWAINSKWNVDPDPELPEGGPVGAIMGACYAMRREWYHRMGDPLAILGAWGGDEEILSACTWLMGGQCYLLPFTCGHIWAAPRERKGFKADRSGNRKDITPQEWLQIWANQYAILDALPIPAVELQELVAFLDRNNPRPEKMREIVATRETAITNLKNMLKRDGLKEDLTTWEQLKGMGILRERTKMTIEKKESVIPHCPRCGKVCRSNIGTHHLRCNQCGRVLP